MKSKNLYIEHVAYIILPINFLFFSKREIEPMEIVSLLYVLGFLEYVMVCLV